MRWLVSYEYRAVFRMRDGSLRYGEAVRTVEPWDKHPVEYVVQMARRLHDMSPESRADEITAIFSVIEIPPKYDRDDFLEAIM